MLIAACPIKSSHLLEGIYRANKQVEVIKRHNNCQTYIVTVNSQRSKCSVSQLNCYFTAIILTESIIYENIFVINQQLKEFLTEIMKF